MFQDLYLGFVSIRYGIQRQLPLKEELITCSSQENGSCHTLQSHVICREAEGMREAPLKAFMTTVLGSC